MAMVWNLRVSDVRFHQFRIVMAVPRESQYGQQNALLALGSELWRIYSSFAVDDLYSECVRRSVDGSLWQVYVRRCIHNFSLIHLNLVDSIAAWCEEGNIKQEL